MAILLGLDSSTQSLSGFLLDSELGVYLARETVSFGKDLADYKMPNGFFEGSEEGEVFSDPLLWLDALDFLMAKLAASGVPLGEVRALSGSGQQHGSVYLNKAFFEVVGRLEGDRSLADQFKGSFSREVSPIWMDSSTRAQCDSIEQELGGAKEVCRRSGSVAVERFTGPQIRKFWETDRLAYDETARIHLVSSFLASVMAGEDAPIDTGDGAGMNLMDLASGSWDPDLLAATAPDLEEKLPSIVPGSHVIGKVSSYFVEKYGFSEDCDVVTWSGDNPCSLVGMGAARPGSLVISLGTSDTLFAAMPQPRTDPAGYGHAFGNPIGGFMSLLCFRNGSLARENLKERFQLSWDDFEKEGLARTEPGNGGRVIYPYAEDEITPLLPATGVTCADQGDWENEPTREEWVRGLVEGQILNIKIHAEWLGVLSDEEAGDLFLTGGASVNDGIAQIISDIFGRRVRRLQVDGSAALGAAMRAGVACGEDLEELESRFCAPEAGRDILPRDEYEADYRELEKIFTSGLDKLFKGR